MSEGVPAAPAVTSGAAPSASSPLRGRGGGRGRGFVNRGGRGGSFHGRGRGGPVSGRGGRGRGRGEGRGADRGRARGVGSPHRSRTGKKRSREDQSTSKDNRFYADGTPVDPDAPQSPNTQQPRKEKENKKTTSDFELLRTAFTDAAAIAEFVRDHGEKRLTEVKQMNMFLQAISNRPDALYAELMNTFKPQIVAVLDRMYGIYSSNGTAMPPCAHEFVIRCEQHGVRKVSWAGDLPAKENEEVPLLTPREVLKRLGSLHPVGRLQRLTELCSSVDDMATCVAKAAALFTASSGAADGEEEQASRPVVDYATKCQLISKLASKARRVVTAQPAKSGPSETEAKAVDKAAQPDASATQQRAEELPPTMEEKTEGGGAEASAKVAAVLCDLTDEERASFKELVSNLLEMLQLTLAARPQTTAMKPTGKFMHFTDWCRANGLLRSSDEPIVEALGAEAEEDLASTAAQLESVITLKGLPAGDGDALRAALDDLWRAGGERHFAPYSADVLSAVATAASADGITEDLRKLVADRLVKTQVALQDKGVELPRRALRLVNNEQNKVKQAALAQQLEEERLARDDVMSRAIRSRGRQTDRTHGSTSAEASENETSEKAEEVDEEAESLDNLLDHETDSDEDDN